MAKIAPGNSLVSFLRTEENAHIRAGEKEE